MYGARAARWVVAGTSIATVATVATLACGSSDDRVVVFAASSLTDVFGRIEVDYEQSHPGVDVVVNFGGSSSLVAQLGEGAPVDVLATADLPTMERASWAITADSIVFARSDLVIAVERGNPLDIRGLESLPDAALVVLASPGVPAGAYSQQILACAGVDLKPVSLEQNVRSVAAKVALGEADAGLVYRTEIGDELAAVEVPSGCEVTAEYAIAPISDEAAALDLIAYVTGPEGAAALAEAGFETP
jgi:molybdate transport system substrate-binding protein